MDFLYIILGLVLLVLGGDWLLKAAVGISLKLKISKIIIGLTVVSFATSAPELIVSINAAMAGFPDVALGNVVGSNIANIGLVLAVVMIISNMKVERSFFATDWPAMIIASFLLLAVLLYDNTIGRVEGLVFFISLILFVVYLIKTQKTAVDLSEVTVEEKQTNPYFILLFLVFGGASLWGGSELLVFGAVNVAESFGVSERIIAVTVVSVGTSVPELAASVMAAIKKESDISIGNIIGSNIFNILSVLGITAMIHPITVKDQGLVNFDIYWMLGFAVILLPLILIPKKGVLDRPAGIVLLAGYITFLYLTFK
uniref:calcium/sodium antiporter n=1 Tax=Flavobacterium sp. TaxID=239 RepID=UPI004049A667